MNHRVSCPDNMEWNICCEDTWPTTKYSVHTRLRRRVGKDKVATSNNLSTSYFQSYSHRTCWFAHATHVHQRQNSHEPSCIIGWRDEETRLKSIFLCITFAARCQTFSEQCDTAVWVGSTITSYHRIFYQSGQQIHTHTLSTCIYSLPWHSGWVPSQVPLFRQVLSGEPFSM